MSGNRIRVAMIVADEREVLRRYSDPEPFFGAAPTALLSGLVEFPSCEVHVISCLQQSVISPTKLGDNISFHPLVIPKWGWLRSGYAGCIAAIRRKLKALQPDVVHGQGTERYYALAAAFSGFPNVITIHGNMRHLASLDRARPLSFLWMHARFERFVLPRTMGVFCNSAHTERLVRPLARRVWRVPHALLPCYFSPLDRHPPKAPIFLNIGTVSPLKQQVELLAALEALHTQVAGFQVEFFGRVDRTSDYGARFLSELDRPAVRGFARYWGFKKPDELVRRLDSASALIHVSQEESFGLVMAEALSRNLKLFAFKAGAVEEIAGGVDGAELLELNDWERLSQGIKLWLQAGSPLPSRAAAEMRKRYSPEAVARQHVQIYRKILNNPA